MAHLTIIELQKMSQAQAKKLRQMPGMTDDLYQLLTLFHARLKLLEQSRPAEKQG
jgi:hypothetical protein